ncbi:hypothetical protein [Streptomyces sp. NPDC020742]|uniref:hypothetical protein n=1 Tax=unclassified Streptomyces TaxID=2593676 RepID=UPI0033CDE438
MAQQDIKTDIMERLDALNTLMPELRKMDSDAKRLKAEVATLNAKLASSDRELGNAEFADLVDNTLLSW